MNKEQENTFLNGLEENKQKLLRLCSVYAIDNDDKKDLFQEVAYNVWRSMPSFQSKSSINTWMFKIALNVCLRLQKKNNTRQERRTSLDGITIKDVETEESSNDQNKQLIQLRNCIKKLNEADKAVITLYLEEMPYNEIANITGLSENHVAVKLKRTKKKLLNCINNKK